MLVVLQLVPNFGHSKNLMIPNGVLKLVWKIIHKTSKCVNNLPTTCISTFPHIEIPSSYEKALLIISVTFDFSSKYSDPHNIFR
jgi:hypothetical protein